MTSQTLGRLEQVDLRTIWATEATAFTPWLAQPENLAILGETLGIDLELEAQERAVGPFRADIRCKDIDTDRWVLIENQLERTDHIHLGQLLTYAFAFLLFDPYLFRGVARLDYDRSGHARVQRAEIFVSAGLREGEGKAIVGVERVRLKQPGCRGDGVRYVVLVAPSHRRSRLHGEARRYEGKIVDFGGRVFRTHRAGKKDDRPPADKRRRSRLENCVISPVHGLSLAVACR